MWNIINLVTRKLSFGRPPSSVFEEKIPYTVRQLSTEGTTEVDDGKGLRPSLTLTYWTFNVCGGNEYRVTCHQGSPGPLHQKSIYHTQV